MTVITVSRELGSRGSQIAENTARALGYHFMDKRAIGLILGEFGMVEFGREYELAPSIWDFFDANRVERRAEMVSLLNKVILALAQHGNIVILGRAGFAVLEGFSDLLNVRIQAPTAQRLRQMMADKDMLDLARAEAYLKDNDQNRTDFIESFYDVKWDAAKAFDIVIDTSKISPQLATEWLTTAARNLEKEPARGDKITANIAVDPVLHSSVCKALQCENDHIP